MGVVLNVHFCECLYFHMWCVRVCPCACVHVCVCVRACVCACVRACVCGCVRACVYFCVYVCVLYICDSLSVSPNKVNMFTRETRQ